MRGSKTPHRWPVWLARHAGLDANPLRRRSDRIEAWVRLSLVVAFLVGGPVAGWEAAQWAQSAQVQAARAAQATQRLVPATLLRNATAAPVYPYPSLNRAWVAARWKAADGAVRTGEIPAPIGARAGSTVWVLTDPAGMLIEPPLPRGEVRGMALMMAVTTPVVLALLLMVILGVTRQILDRRRMASWTHAWAVVEPHWSRRAR